MPRKKNRSTLQRKPSLLFIESPVHVQKNVPSPVFCARHPPTANTVQVEEMHHLSWVSPQFRQGSSSTHEGRRVTRRRRKSIACLRNINKENTCNGLNDLRRNVNYKFQSLRFLGEPSINASEVEDVHITVDSASEDEQELENEKGDLDIPENMTGENVKKAKHDKESGRLLEERKKIKQTDDTRTHRVSKKIAEKHESSDNDELSSLDKSCTEALNESSKIDFTQVRKRSTAAPPVKRLFATQLGDAGQFDIDGAVVTNDRTQGNKELEPDSEAISETEPETVSESESGADTPPAARRSLRIQMLKNLVQATPAQQKSMTVLAPDTPEEEYGWSLRKRQLKHYMKK